MTMLALSYLTILLSISIISTSTNDFFNRNNVCYQRAAIQRLFRIYDKIYFELEDESNRYIVYTLSTNQFEQSIVNKNDLFTNNYGNYFDSILSASQINGDDYYNHLDDNVLLHKEFDKYFDNAEWQRCNTTKRFIKKGNEKIIRIWGYITLLNTSLITYEDFILIDGRLDYRPQLPQTNNILWKTFEDNDKQMACVLYLSDKGTIGITRSSEWQYIRNKIYETEINEKMITKRQQYLNETDPMDRIPIPRLYYQKDVHSCVELNHSIMFLTSFERFWIFSRNRFIGNCHPNEHSINLHWPYFRKYYEASIDSIFCDEDGLSFDSDTLIDNLLSPIQSFIDSNPSDVDVSESQNIDEANDERQSDIFFMLLIGFFMGAFIFVMLTFILLFVQKDFFKRNNRLI